MKSSLFTINGSLAYRLGDVVRGYIRKRETSNYNSYITRYPNTIASKYILATQDLTDENKDSNIQVLDSIIDDNPVNHACMHIRAHDILSRFSEGEYIYNREPSDLFKNFQPRYLSEYGVIDFLLQNNITTVYLFCASHYNDNNSKLTLQLIEECVSILRDGGITAQYAEESHPDVAFTHMCNSKFMIGTQLGYSYLVCKVVNYRKRPAFFGDMFLS